MACNTITIDNCFNFKPLYSFILYFIYLQSGAKAFENCTIDVPEEADNDLDLESNELNDVY